jgi:rubrerythrin
MTEITACYPAGVIGTTAENLRDAAGGEHEEWTGLYPAFAAKAKEEGFEAVASLFENVCIAEKQHEKRYLGLLKNIQNDTVFKKPQKVVWRCRNCGFIHEGEEAINVCPACAHPQAHFELLAENW